MLSQGNGGRDNLPVGTILAYTGSLNKIPSGWALCNGANGTPNLTGRFLEGVTASAGTFKTAGLPNITGELHFWKFFEHLEGMSGSLSVKSEPPNSIVGHDSTEWDNSNQYLIFDASKSNPIYGNSTTVQPNSYTVYYIMKIK